jgi:hypothetical protein
MGNMVKHVIAGIHVAGSRASSAGYRQSLPSMVVIFARAWTA